MEAPGLEIGVKYFDWSPAPLAWEYLFCPPKEALQIILTRIDRAPHQVGFRDFLDTYAIFARLPDAVGDDGKRLAVPFAMIVSGPPVAEAEALRQFLKSAGWTPQAALTFQEAA